MARIGIKRAVPWACFACLGVLSAAASWYVTRPMPYPKPFPSMVHGQPVRWVADDTIRSLFAGVSESDVERIHLRGGDVTSVPTETVITNPGLIRRYLIGVKGALRRSDSKSGMADPSAFWMPDHAWFELKQGRSVRVEFYADIIQGQRPGMVGGTVSPEFQAALRETGIPPGREDSIVNQLLIAGVAQLRSR